MSPTEFNIAVDVVVRHWLTLSVDDNGNVAEDSFDMTVADRLALFYADNGLLSVGIYYIRGV